MLVLLAPQFKRPMDSVWHGLAPWASRASGARPRAEPVCGVALDGLMSLSFSQALMGGSERWGLHWSLGNCGQAPREEAAAFSFGSGTSMSD